LIQKYYLKPEQNSTGVKWYFYPGCASRANAFSRYPDGVGACICKPLKPQCSAKKKSIGLIYRVMVHKSKPQNVITLKLHHKFTDLLNLVLNLLNLINLWIYK